jgi:hypothetical protein
MERMPVFNLGSLRSDSSLESTSLRMFRLRASPQGPGHQETKDLAGSFLCGVTWRHSSDRQLARRCPALRNSPQDVCISEGFAKGHHFLASINLITASVAFDYRFRSKHLSLTIEAPRAGLELRTRGRSFRLRHRSSVVRCSSFGNELHRVFAAVIDPSM